MGIEPTSEAWEASILPLYDARSAVWLSKLYTTKPLSVPACLRPTVFSRNRIDFRDVPRASKDPTLSVQMDPLPNALFGELLVTKAVDRVIIHDARCLHQRVADRRSNKTEPALL